MKTMKNQRESLGQCWDHEGQLLDDTVL